MTATLQRMRVIEGDITCLAVDAIVTSANEALCGGHGVDGAVHRAAGAGLFAECRGLGICNPGQAKLTGGHLLPAKHVIHTVGPVWEGGQFNESETLRACYLASLAIAAESGFATIAFPCIATGVYEYPRGEACATAIESTKQWLELHELPREVIFCCYEQEDAELYRNELSRL